MGSATYGDHVRYAIFTPNFGTLSDPALLAELASAAEEAGWDGWFLWDHVVYRMGDEPVVDPWIALAVMARVTGRLQLGPMVTPLPRRRPWNLARQATTLDHLSEGRVILGVGLGSLNTPEFAGFGEEQDLRRRGAMLDEGLELMADLWSGQLVNHHGPHYQVEGVRFLPRPIQRPLPVWLAATWPHRRPLQRAAHWQGVFPLGLPGPAALAEVADIVGPGKDIAVDDGRFSPDEWQRAGATWWLERLPADIATRDLEARIQAGPPRD
jgi:alkanesulfonate monooxygenase SsuD/methylene tetrahydromethanopterin reductase-like flavin-dependent oxidoreductase (luciferase family)